MSEGPVTRDARRLTTMLANPTDVAPALHRSVLTLTPDQYRRLEEKFSSFGDDLSPTAAAIRYGQQQVLAAIRSGFLTW